MHTAKISIKRKSEESQIVKSLRLRLTQVKSVFEGNCK